MTSQWPEAMSAANQMSTIDTVTSPNSGGARTVALMARGWSPAIFGFPGESISDHNHERESELFSVFHFSFGFKLP